MHEIKILILSCGTGGGHNSAALAIQEKLLNKNIKADFVEYLDIIDEKVKNRVNKMYINSTKGNGNIFKVAYHLGELYEKTNHGSFTGSGYTDRITARFCAGYSLKPR